MKNRICWCWLFIGTMSSVFSQSLPVIAHHDESKVVTNAEAYDVGDVNGDGFNDIALIAYTSTLQKKVTIITGRSGSVIHGLQPWAITQTGPLEFIKTPDLDGDSSAEICYLEKVGFAPGVTDEMRVISGSSNVLIGNTVLGPSSSVKPLAVALGDVTGDGISDWAVSRVEFIALNYWTSTPVTSIDVIDGASFQATNLVQYNNAVLTPGGLVAIGDVDGDGFPDLAASSGATSVIAPQGGSATVFSGQTGQALRSWFGQAGDALGAKMVGLSDIDGDGAREVAIFSPGADIVGVDTGRVRIFSTGFGFLVVEVLPALGERIIGLTKAQDHNGDGFQDFIVTIENVTSALVRREMRSGINGLALFILSATETPVGDLNNDGIDDFASFTANQPALGQTRFETTTMLGALSYGYSISQGTLSFHWETGNFIPANGALALTGAPPLTSIVGIVSFAPDNGFVPGTNLPLFVSNAPGDIFGLFSFVTDAVGEHRDFVNLAQPGLAGVQVYVQYGVLGTVPTTTSAVELLFGP